MRLFKKDRLLKCVDKSNLVYEIGRVYKLKIKKTILIRSFQ